MYDEIKPSFNHAPTGRRMGRLQGKLDDIAMELVTMQRAELAGTEPDEEVIAAFDLAMGSLANMAEGVENAIARLNTTGRR